MAIIRSTFFFLFGAGCGVYIAQNYKVPSMKQLARTWLSKAKGVEESYRKDKD